MSKDIKNSLPILTYQTGLEEAFLIGTDAQLRDFAKSIINAIDDAKHDTFFGVDAKVKPLRTRILDGKGCLSIDHIVIVDEDKLKDDIFNNVWNS